MSKPKKKPAAKPAKTNNIKTNNDYTHIMCVLDRSGSMDSIKNDMIGGFNTFLADQKKVKGKATIDLIQFDDHYDILLEMKDLSEATDLTDKTYVPRGCTALLDAIGRTIRRNEESINKLTDKPGKVICLILTDGEENASTEYDNAAIKKLITEKTDKEKWTFVYIGANQDSFAVGQKFGIKSGNVANFVSTGVGTRSAMNGLSQTMSSYRCSASASTEDYFGGAKNISEDTPPTLTGQ